MFRSNKLFITAVVALVALVAGPAYATTATEGTAALAEMLCEGEGGVFEAYWEDEQGSGNYTVSVTCGSGTSFESGFRCPGCEPV